MDIRLLADCRDSIDELVKWVGEEWAEENHSPKELRDEYESFCNRDAPPFSVVAFYGEAPVGVASIKRFEMGMLYPEREFWFGGLLVPLSLRGRGIGKLLLTRAMQIAEGMGIKHLSLNTTIPSLYEKHGWKVVERRNFLGEDVIVMDICLGENKREKHIALK